MRKSNTPSGSIPIPKPEMTLIQTYFEALQQATEIALLHADGDDIITQVRGGSSSLTTKDPKLVVKNVHELRTTILDQGYSLKDIDIDHPSIQTTMRRNKKGISVKKGNGENNPPPFNHEVLELIKDRSKDKSKPGSRVAGDKAHLALSIEGGGMRGAVSAGMASPIAVLGLCDAFDSIYGSSA